jgi:hypothetical protein
LVFFAAVNIPRLLPLLGLWWIAGCAKAPAEDGGQLTDQPDAGMFGFLADGAPVTPGADADPGGGGGGGGSTTLTQSSSMSITDANSIACADGLGFTVENHYYRKFDLAAAGQPTGFVVDRVSFGIELATAQDVDVVLHTLNGAFEVGNLTEIGRAQVAVPEALSAIMVDVDVAGTAPAGSTLVVELEAPDNFGVLYVGSNASGETGSTYIRASECSIMAPTPIGDISDATMHWVLNVVGDPL